MVTTIKLPELLTVVEGLSLEDKALLLEQLQKDLGDYLYQRRQARARALIEKAAKILRADFGATEVIAFGSLLGQIIIPGRRGEVEIAAWGIAYGKPYLAAADAIAAIDPDLTVDLLDLDIYSQEDLEAIKEYGTSL